MQDESREWCWQLPWVLASCQEQPAVDQDGCDGLQNQLPELARRGETRALCTERREAGSTDSELESSTTVSAIPERCLGEYQNDAWIIDRYVDGHTPTLTYSFANNGELAQHIADAQASWLPGSPTSAALTRQTDPELINKNRNTACPASLPRPPGTECDEYPFASTNQGAFLGNGYSQRMILKDANQQGGRELNAFYRNNRVMNFDPFYVEVVGS
ncbi:MULTISPECIES: NucA/NucB deoxyribonuclease domain-containing protein [unclassified Saccharopolyspora]|uniref:NucA/NucB deoxyribonuclease domain-containing protein n=1 Tax=unclassified Saccharopolyspora TaxID=2646250 RepID=UPI001CD344C9|nr:MULTISPECIES: NucA/NucB deoxyribonuclease domain-containing protein [unclassified Saccharopolyspora]MCA1186703.1 hypothetical protein [Saccharopolyspora sp. 6T]MCA1278356.1 hypothetical protein [Saccharopolyspora sp. 7B]